MPARRSRHRRQGTRSIPDRPDQGSRPEHGRDRAGTSSGRSPSTMTPSTPPRRSTSATISPTPPTACRSRPSSPPPTSSPPGGKPRTTVTPLAVGHPGAGSPDPDRGPPHTGPGLRRQRHPDLQPAYIRHVVCTCMGSPFPVCDDFSFDTATRPPGPIGPGPVCVTVQRRRHPDRVQLLATSRADSCPSDPQFPAPNGVISPGETLNLTLAIRNTGGSNVRPSRRPSPAP